MIDVKCVKKTLVTQRYSQEPLFPSHSWKRGSAFVQLHGFLIRGPAAQIYICVHFCFCRTVLYSRIMVVVVGGVVYQLNS